MKDKLLHSIGKQIKFLASHYLVFGYLEKDDVIELKKLVDRLDEETYIF